jgi:hypothetical protein
MNPTTNKFHKTTIVSVNTLIVSFIMLFSMILTGLESYSLFQRADYKAWGLLTISCFFSIVLFINLLSNKKDSYQFYPQQTFHG